MEQSGIFEIIKVMKNPATITKFQDLEVYRITCNAMFCVFDYIFPSLPRDEEIDTQLQLKKCVMAVPRLIAEGYSSRNNTEDLSKYIAEAIIESNNSILLLNLIANFFPSYVQAGLCRDLIKAYDKASKQLCDLGASLNKNSQIALAKEK